MVPGRIRHRSLSLTILAAKRRGGAGDGSSSRSYCLASCALGGMLGIPCTGHPGEARGFEMQLGLDILSVGKNVHQPKLDDSLCSASINLS